MKRKAEFLTTEHTEDTEKRVCECVGARGRRRPAAPQREGVINELNELSELWERECQAK